MTLADLCSGVSQSPTSLTRRRIAAYGGDNPLFLVCVQDFGRTGPLFFIESAIKAGLLIAMAEPPNSLWSERNHRGNLWSAGIRSQLQQCQGTQNYPNLLHPALQQRAQLLLILFGDIDSQKGNDPYPEYMRACASCSPSDLDLSEISLDLF